MFRIPVVLASFLIFQSTPAAALNVGELMKQCLFYTNDLEINSPEDLVCLSYIKGVGNLSAALCRNPGAKVLGTNYTGGQTQLTAIVKDFVNLAENTPQDWDYNSAVHVLMAVRAKAGGCE